MDDERCHQCGRMPGAVYTDADDDEVTELRARAERAEAELSKADGDAEEWASMASGFAAKLAAKDKALEAILEISRDRERFVMMGPMGWSEAEQIAKRALGGEAQQEQDKELSDGD